MFVRFLVTVFLVMFTSFSQAQRLPIPAPGKAVAIVPGIYNIVGNYPSNVAAWTACVQLSQIMWHSSYTISQMCTFPDEATVAAYKGESIMMHGGYYIYPIENGSEETYYMGFWHCPNNDEWRYFENENTCIQVTKIGKFPSPKDNGRNCPTCGNPIVMGRAGKVQTEVDFHDDGPGGLSIIRMYNGDPYGMLQNLGGNFGAQWSFIRTSRLLIENISPKYDCYRRGDNGQIACFPGLASPGTITVSAIRPDGKILKFTKDSAGLWSSDADVAESLSVEYAPGGTAQSGWILTTASGTRESYDTQGQLISLQRRYGGSHRYTYSDGATNDTGIGRYPEDAPVCNNSQSGATIGAKHIVCITDDWGRQLNFEYDGKGRLSKIIIPNGENYLYTYDGVSGGCINDSARPCSANNLTSVTFPDGKAKLYHYNEFGLGLINNGIPCANMTSAGDGYLSFLNVLNGITDENGNRYASWGYDCAKQAISSQHAGGVDRVDIAYGGRAADDSQFLTVTSTMGTSAKPVKVARAYHYQLILGVSKNDSVDSRCDSCGSFASKIYDSRGNVLTGKDWNGNVTQFTYESVRNLEISRIEAKGTSIERTTTTTWHSTMELPLKVWEPKRLTSYSYDDLGRVLTRTEQATTDETGATGSSAALSGTPRIWKYTYNTSGQVLSVTGPRTDVLDVTSYSYDSAGNLATVTNPLGHVTSYSNYDRNGRVGHVSAANGLATDIRYNSRGWVTAQTVSDGTVTETTTFDYDGVGQVKKATFPDGSYLSYSYDPAHRLTEVADSAGNRIVYTLDNVGNRIGEQVSGADGVVASQISRVFDTFKNLTQITGAQQ